MLRSRTNWFFFVTIFFLIFKSLKKAEHIDTKKRNDTAKNEWTILWNERGEQIGDLFIQLLVLSSHRRDIGDIDYVKKLKISWKGTEPKIQVPPFKLP